MIKKEEILIPCSKQTTLSALVYFPEKEIKGALLIAPATGIKKEFYSSFSNFLAESGYGVLSFENDGIGQSLVGKIKDCQASLITWGEVDMTKALDKLMEIFPNKNYHLVGHSAGGQLFGLMKNSEKLSSIVTVASSSGNLKKIKKGLFALQGQFFMNIYIPLSNLLVGYTNSKLVGMGEPLPKKVAAHWSKWCNGSGYIKTDFGKEIRHHNYDTLQKPTLWITLTDDTIATEENAQEMMEVCKNLEIERLILNPNELGIKEIGHMKFFSSKNSQLWHHVSCWLEKHK